MRAPFRLVDRSMTPITRSSLVTGIASARTGTPEVQSGSLSRWMRRSRRAVSSTGRSPGPTTVPTTSSGNDVGPVVGRICATATQPGLTESSGPRCGTHKIRSANDKSARSCQSDTRECSHSRSGPDRLVRFLARSVRVGTLP